MSSRCLPIRVQDVFKTSSRRVCKTSGNSRRLGRPKIVTLKLSSRRLQDIFSTPLPAWMFAGMIVIFLLIILSHITGSKSLFLVLLFDPSPVAMIQWYWQLYCKAFLILTAFSCCTEYNAKQPGVFLLT